MLHKSFPNTILRVFL